MKNWKALANIKRQGCGLNVLSYYGLIPQTSAREETVCLTSKGTSIFRIVDYMNHYFIKNGIVDNEYFILRNELLKGLQLIIHFINQYKNHSYAIIFKVYKDNIHQDNIFSEIGHTVSITCNNQEIVYIDPQQSLFEPIQGTQEEQVNKLYGFFSNYFYKYIDIIFTYRNAKTDFDSDRPLYDKKTIIVDFIQNEHFVLRPRPFNITYGGGGNYKKKKAKTRNNNKKKIKNKTKTIKNKRKPKKKKQSGGYDHFEEMMLNADKKNGIKSVIVLQP